MEWQLFELRVFTHLSLLDMRALYSYGTEEGARPREGTRQGPSLSLPLTPDESGTRVHVLAPLSWPRVLMRYALL